MRFRHTAGAINQEPPVALGRLPLLGHVHKMLRNPLYFVENIRKYGPAATIYLGRSPAYILNDPALIQRMLVDDVKSFDKGVQYDKLGALLGNGLSTTTGTIHRDRRRLMQPAFRHDRVQRYAELIRETVLSTMDEWCAGDVLDVTEEMRKLSLKIVARAFCSTTLDSAAITVIQRDLPTVLDSITWRALSPFPFIEELPLPFNRRFKAANIRLRAAIDDVINHYETTAVEGEDDLLAMLLAASRDTDAPPVSRSDIRDELVNLLFAGTETTANALSWLWHVVATHPEMEEGIVSDSRRGDHTYTSRVVHEVLRLYPPPWLISRRVRDEIHWGNVKLRAGSTVLFSPYAVQRDPVAYPDPQKFDPDRWLPENNAAGRRQTYLSFGSGAHKCIGDKFALLEMSIVATTIAEKFRLIPAAPAEQKAAATLMPRTLQARIEKRSPTNGARHNERHKGDASYVAHY